MEATTSHMRSRSSCECEKVITRLITLGYLCNTLEKGRQRQFLKYKELSCIGAVVHQYRPFITKIFSLFENAFLITKINDGMFLCRPTNRPCERFDVGIADDQVLGYWKAD